ncbi:putative phage-related endonuclease [Bradyrhizobium sp. RT7b]
MASVQANAADAPNHILRFNPNDQRHFIGGSDARIVMGDDQDALVRLWREKRGEAEPENLLDNLIVQLGTVTEVLKITCDRVLANVFSRRAPPSLGAW